jgi:hypothetical protein
LEDLGCARDSLTANKATTKSQIQNSRVADFEISNKSELDAVTKRIQGTGDELTKDQAKDGYFTQDSS